MLRPASAVSVEDVKAGRGATASLVPSRFHLVRDIIIDSRQQGLSSADAVAMAKAILEDFDAAASHTENVDTNVLSSWEDFQTRSQWFEQGEFPHLAHWVQANVMRAKLWPDLFKDDDHDRRRVARKKGMRAVLEAMLEAAPNLVWGKWHPPELEGRDIINDLQAIVLTRQLVTQRVKANDAPALWKLEEGRLGRVHIELVSTPEACSGLTGVKTVRDANLAHYLCKPMLGIGCNFDQRHRNRYPGITAETILRQKCLASERWLARTEPGRRRHYWGVVNDPSPTTS